MTSPLDEKTPSFDMCQVTVANVSALHELRSRRQITVKLLYSLSSVDTYFEDRHLASDRYWRGKPDTYRRICVSPPLSLSTILFNNKRTEEQETGQREESREREAFKLATAQPENRRKQKEKGGGTLKRKKQMMGD